MENFKSIKDYLMEAFETANRSTILYRVIYIGQHHFSIVEDLKSYFQRIIDHSNRCYSFEKLTGFLLCYQNLFIHLIEGSEDVINSHLVLLCSEMRTSELHNMKIVIIWPHLIARATNSWFAKLGHPRKSDNKVYATCQASPFVRLCINSMCNLAETLSGKESSQMSPDRHNGDSKNIDPIPVGLVPKLPDADQIEFLTNCDVLFGLQEAYESMYHISRIAYDDIVWPAPSIYIPYDIIKIPDLG